MINLSEEQQIIRDSVKRYLLENYPFDQRQRHVSSPNGFDTEQWQTFAELGWLGISFPEHYGGYGGSLIDAALITEQLGRFLLRCPYLCSTVGAGTILLHAASEAQKTEYLTGIAEGRTIVCCGLHDKDHVRKAASVTSAKATCIENGFELTGAKSLTPYPRQADHFIISARLNDELRLFMVPAHSDGLGVSEYKMYDGSRAGDISLSAVKVGVDAVLPGNAGEAIRISNENESAMLGVESSGMMWAIQEQVLEYVRIREQFGCRLSEFQALQHRIVDIYVDCQLVQSMAWDAVEAVVTEPDYAKRTDRVTAARSYIGEKGRRVGKEGIQLHGGIGMTNDIPIGHYLKRLTAIDCLMKM